MDGLDLSPFFTTKAQANDFSARISVVEEKTYEVNFNLEQQLQSQLGLKRKDEFISLLRENNIPAGSTSELNKFFKKIKKTISVMPKATLTLAIEPNEQILNAISDWFVLNLKQQVLLDIQINPELIAGAAINYQGKYYNASVKPVFDETLSAASASNVNNVDQNGASQSEKTGQFKSQKPMSE